MTAKHLAGEAPDELPGQSTAGGGGGGVPEAPIDGELYGRKDAGWEVVPDAPAPTAPANVFPRVMSKAAFYSFESVTIQDGVYTSTTSSANMLNLFPIAVTHPFEVAFLGLYLNAVFTGQVRIVLYDSDPLTGAPKNLVFSQTVNLTSANFDQYSYLTTPTEIPAGVYWLATHCAAPLNLKAIPRQYTPAIASYDLFYPVNAVDFSTSYAGGSPADLGDTSENVTYYDDVPYLFLGGNNY